LSKCIAHRQLYHSRCAGGRDPPKDRIELRCIRISEVGMIEHIVEGAAELQILRLGNAELLPSSEIDVPVPGSLQEANSRVSECTGRILCECGGIEPGVDLVLLASITGRPPISNDVCSISSDSRE